MADSARPEKGAPQISGPAVTIRTSSGTRIELSLPEYRLALLWLVDFGGDWDALEYSTRFVTRGADKRALVQDRLRSLAPHLPALVSRGVDSLEILAARFWFRQE